MAAGKTVVVDVTCKDAEDFRAQQEKLKERIRLSMYGSIGFWHLYLLNMLYKLRGRVDNLIKRYQE